MIYLDNHATTQLDPRVFEAMLPLMWEQYANAGSVTHAAGRAVAEMVERAIAQMAAEIGAANDEIVITSGATESNNLAIFGTCLHPRQKRRRVVSVATEHKAVLDPLARLQSQGFDVQLVPVSKYPAPDAGLVDLQALRRAINVDTALVSVMLANNEIGVIQPLPEIARLCREVDCLLHTDATQAVGRIPVDVERLDVDLLSFSAHKFYGPKGVGGLFVRRRGRRVKLLAQIFGGGQQQNFRSGTLNTAGIIGMQVALSTCTRAMSSEQPRLLGLRNRLYDLLAQQLGDLRLNGPALDEDAGELRMVDNLNCCFYPFEGQSLMLATSELAVSSGSSCTSANPSPSHVLQAIGLTEEESRSSLRFGLGRFNTDQEVEQAAAMLVAAVEELRKLR